MEFLVSAAHWPTDVSFSLAKWNQLLIGWLKSAAHWPSEICCSLANWNHLLIGQLMSAAHWPNEISCSLANWNLLLIGQLKSAAHWLTEMIKSLANWNQLYFLDAIASVGLHMSVGRCPFWWWNFCKHFVYSWWNFHTDVSCSLAIWSKLLIGQVKSAAHWPSDVSCSSAN